MAVEPAPAEVRVRFLVVSSLGCQHLATAGTCEKCLWQCHRVCELRIEPLKQIQEVLWLGQHCEASDNCHHASMHLPLIVNLLQVQAPAAASGAYEVYIQDVSVTALVRYAKCSSQLSVPHNDTTQLSPGFSIRCSFLLATLLQDTLSAPYAIKGAYLRGIKEGVDVLPDTPLLVFINAKSGGRSGPELALALTRAVGRAQVLQQQNEQHPGAASLHSRMCGAELCCAACM